MFSQKPLCFLDIQWIVVIASLNMDISMDIHSTSVDMDMDMNVNFYIHGNPGYFSLIFGTFGNNQSKKHKITEGRIFGLLHSTVLT